MIYIICPDHDKPSGGIRVLYRVCDVLNGVGLTAQIVHHAKDYRIDWFANETAVIGVQDLNIYEDDLLVIPEVFGKAICDFAPGVTRVVLNQNAYFTANRIISAGVPNAYRADDILSVLCVSDDNEQFLRYAFPQMDVRRVHVAIGREFGESPSVERLPRHLSYMPRKNKDGAEELLWLLNQRNALDGWTVEAIDGYSEAETVEAMAKSGLFLAFGDREGFGLPPLEAMASRCVVVGYPALGGREFFDPAFSFPISDGDVLQFARTVEAVIARWDDDQEQLVQMTAAAAQFVMENYSTQREAKDISVLFSKFAASAALREHVSVGFDASLVTPESAQGVKLSDRQLLEEKC